MDKEFKDYYDILGVKPDASFENIRKAAERKVKLLGWNSGIGRLEVNEALFVLSNPETRKSYDQELREKIGQARFEYRCANSEEELVRAAKKIAEEKAARQEIEEQKVEQERILEEQQEKKQIEQVENIEKKLGNQIENENKDISVSSTPIENNVKVKKEEPDDKLNMPKSNFDKTISKLGTPSSSYSKYSFGNNKLLKFTIDTSSIFGGMMIAGIPGLIVGVTVAILANELIDKSRKFKLVRTPKQKTVEKPVGQKIVSVETAETRLIEEYNKKTESQIRNLLNRPLDARHNNYELEIAKLKYLNQLDLLEKRMEFKLNEAQKDGLKVKHRLEVLALENQYNKAKKSFERLKNYMPTNNKNDKLTLLNKNIEEVNKQLSNTNITIHKKNSLKLRITKLQQQRISLIDKMILKKNGISSKQNLLAYFARKNNDSVDKHNSVYNVQEQKLH